VGRQIAGSHRDFPLVGLGTLKLDHGDLFARERVTADLAEPMPPEARRLVEGCDVDGSG